MNAEKRKYRIDTEIIAPNPLIRSLIGSFKGPTPRRGKRIKYKAFYNLKLKKNAEQR